MPVTGQANRRWMIVMNTQSQKPGFVRLFIGGFALGAVAILGVQAVHAGPQSIISVAQAATR